MRLSSQSSVADSFSSLVPDEGSDLTLKDGSGTVLFTTGAGPTDISFPAGLNVDALEFDAGSGELVVFLR